MNDYIINSDKEKLQIDIIHGLLRNTYWCKDIPKSLVQKAMDHSLCYGIYHKNTQVGFARVITDEATFAYLCDVIIDENHRGNGLSKKLMEFIMRDSRLQGLRRFCLGTKDAHGLYEKFGFKAPANPKTWMEIKDNDIYTKVAK